MEAQRQLINSNGYRIRKINQAYFAFYGRMPISRARRAAIRLGRM